MIRHPSNRERFLSMTKVQRTPERAEAANAPLWVQVAGLLRQRIESGAEGQDFSDVGLSNELKVSTLVVRQAVQQLVQEGLLVRRRGKGTFLANQPLRGGLSALQCFVDEWSLQGRKVRMELVCRRMVAATMSVAAGLGVSPGQIVAHLVRLRYADELPVAVDYRFMRSELVEGIPDEDFLQESIWRVLRRHRNITPGESRFTIKAAGATPDVARYLEVSVGAPVLDHEVQVLDRFGQVLILGSSLYHADRFVYSTQVREPHV
jgi:GntR family transcriptional regulator